MSGRAEVSSETLERKSGTARSRHLTSATRILVSDLSDLSGDLLEGETPGIWCSRRLMIVSSEAISCNTSVTVMTSGDIQIW